MPYKSFKYPFLMDKMRVHVFIFITLCKSRSKLHFLCASNLSTKAPTVMLAKAVAG